jgi:hypothetical protein
MKRPKMRGEKSSKTTKEEKKTEGKKPAFFEMSQDFFVFFVYSLLPCYETPNCKTRPRPRPKIQGGK